MHGLTAYRRGCRCDTCRDANAGRVRRNRVRRGAEPSRLTHGTVSAYDAGCRCEPCKDERRIRYLLTEGYRVHRWRIFVTEVYRSARQAWEDLRESHRPDPQAVGAAHSTAGCSSDFEFRVLHPPPTFKKTLQGLRHEEPDRDRPAREA